MGKKTAQRDINKDITIDSQVNSHFPYRWSQASLTFNIYFYLFLYLYITRIAVNNDTPHLKSPKNQNRRAALGLASHLARILPMQTIGQVVGKRLTTLILHEVLIIKWEDRSSMDDWKKLDVSFDDLCWSTREFFVAPEFRLTYKLFVLKSFRALVDPCGIWHSPLQVIFYRYICTTIGFAVV